MRKFFKYGLFGGIAVIAFMVSCQKDAPINQINYGYNYFPNNKGHFVIYNVDSTIRNTFSATPDLTYTYQIKEVIDSFYTDGSGRPTQRIVRYKRANSSQPWVVQKVWSANLTKTDAERVEDNIRYVRLVFPMQVNETWNGNVYNTLTNNDGSSYQYASIDQSFSLNNTTFDSTLTVIEDSSRSLVYRRFYIERYARNVGRIYRKYVDLEADSTILQLGTPAWQIDSAIFSELNSGSVMYIESYDSAGNQ